MSDEQRKRLRILAEKLKTSAPTTGNLQGVLAVAVLELLDEIEELRNSEKTGKPPIVLPF